MRHSGDDLRRLSVVPLQFASDQQIELLVGAAHLHIALQRNGIVALHQRIEQFVNGDRDACSLKRFEKSSRSSRRAMVYSAAEPDHVLEPHLVEPFAS